MEATLLLADFAEVVNGKLYIQGAGFSFVGADRPVSVAVALLINVEWVESNLAHSVLLELVDQDGAAVMNGDEPIRVEGQVEVGRPPGSRQGTQFKLPMAVTFHGLTLPAGRYVVRGSIGDDTTVRYTFDAIGGELPR